MYEDADSLLSSTGENGCLKLIEEPGAHSPASMREPPSDAIFSIRSRSLVWPSIVDIDCILLSENNARRELATG